MSSSSPPPPTLTSTTSTNNTQQEPQEEKTNFVKNMGRRFSKFITELISPDDTPPPPMEIGLPYNFQHNQHVQPDPHSSTGFSVSVFIFFITFLCLFISINCLFYLFCS